MWSDLLERIRQIVLTGYETCDRNQRTADGLDAVLASDTEFAIAPAARLARKAMRKMADIGMRMPVALCDRNETLWGGTVCGVPVMSYDEFATKWPRGAVWVASAMYDSSIRSLVAKLGLPQVVPYPYLAHCLPEMFATREYAGLTESVFAANAMSSIEKLATLVADDRSREVLLSKVLFYLTNEKSLLDSIRSQETIYWDASVVQIRPDEVIVDAGAYRGDTLEAYLGVSQGAYRRYYAFEPDPLVIASLRAVASKDLSRIECVEYGVSDQRDRIAFSISGSADTNAVRQGHIDSGDIAYLNVTDLDSFFAGKTPPTFIKMDVEGEERRALAGARSLLQTHKPVLAVSVYHYPQDLWEIPLMIAAGTPGARIYLRHYTREVDDTVCYSVPMES